MKRSQKYDIEIFGAAVVVVLIIIMGLSTVSTGFDIDAQKAETVAEQWAKSWMAQDGEGRYKLMSDHLQQQMDEMGKSQRGQDHVDYEAWMPAWINGSNGDKGMYLKGAYPKVDDYNVEYHKPDGKGKGAFAQKNSALITYEMTDNGAYYYIYQEALILEPANGGWNVSDCEITIDYLSPWSYREGEEIYSNIKDGHGQWRLEPERVAMAFIRDYLDLKDGVLEEWNVLHAVDTLGKRNIKENMLSYQSAEGVTYTLYLYHPIIHPFDAEPDFWAVKEYAYCEKSNTVQEQNIIQGEAMGYSPELY